MPCYVREYRLKVKEKQFVPIPDDAQILSIEYDSEWGLILSAVVSAGAVDPPPQFQVLLLMYPAGAGHLFGLVGAYLGSFVHRSTRYYVFKEHWTDRDRRMMPSTESVE